MVRVENWDSELVRYAEAHRGESFRWGETDCVTLTREALMIMLGEDPWRHLVPRFKTLRKAARLAGELEPEITLRDTGAVEVGYHFGWAGDVALAPGQDDDGLPGISLLLPNRKALVATVADGVVVTDKLALPEGTRFFRYG